LVACSGARELRPDIESIPFGDEITPRHIALMHAFAGTLENGRRFAPAVSA
jgi:hypothetical protein